MRDTIDMAREAGFNLNFRITGSNEALDRLVEYVRADERALAAPVQEPVAFFDPQKESFYWAKPTRVIPPVTVDVEPLPLYTTAKRQWVGLTESEVSEIINEEIGFNSCWGPEESFAKAIEAKLKEKNT
jgi:hypothetical protein